MTNICFPILKKRDYPPCPSINFFFIDTKWHFFPSLKVNLRLLAEVLAFQIFDFLKFFQYREFSQKEGSTSNSRFFKIF